MKFASAGGRPRNLPDELMGFCQEAETALGGGRADLAVVFFTPHFEDDAATIVQTIIRRHPTCALIGCSAEGVIEGTREHERLPAVALMLAQLPGVRLRTFHVPPETLSAIEPGAGWAQCIGVEPAERVNFVFLGDPFSVPVRKVLELFNATYAGRAVVGGMASGCERPGQAVLIADDQIYREGAVGLALTGAVEIQTVVSQGCRPIGHPLVITRCERNIIRALGGRPALEQLREVIESLSKEDARLARESLFVGRVINEYKPSFTRGDFLIRNLLGIDPSSGAIAVGEEMRVGATIQFNVRDQVSADQDLRQMLDGCSGEQAPAGALLFSCNGRGTRMWQTPNHDATAMSECCGPVPVTGFFAAGEIGPVGGTNFIHGHTASIALFRPTG